MTTSSLAGRPASGRLAVLAAGVAVCALLALLAAALARGSAAPTAGAGLAATVPPRPAPSLDLSGFDGSAFRLGQQQGRLVVVNFWASWCGPCREEAAVLERGWRAYQERGVVFVGVNVWDREPAARAFLAALDVSYPNGTDSAGEAAIAYGVRGLPETFFVDRRGHLVRRWIGPMTERGLAATLNDLARQALFD